MADVKRSQARTSNHHAILRVLVALLVVLVLSACESQPLGDAPLRGQILLWHSWPDQEGVLLEELLTKFVSINPQVQVVASYAPLEEIGKRYRARAAMGLGPDLVIMPGAWERDLADAGLVQDLSQLELDTSVYLSTALDTLRHKGRLYALPLSVRTAALYYNKQLASDPPTSLSELLAQASDGKQVLLYTDFYRAFWGIQAFGGQLFEDDGRVILHRGGFANWLGWLKIANNAPGVTLTTDREVGTALFENGQVAYYVGESSEMAALNAALGDGVLGVAPLPDGPIKPAGPFLETEALLFNASSSSTQSAIAIRLAQFLTNVEQQRVLARRSGRIPANAAVRIDPRLSPLVAGFVSQTRMAVPMPNLAQMREVLAYGNDAYLQALEGAYGISETAYRLTDQVNVAHGLEPEAVAEEKVCGLEGTIRMWHTWAEPDASALRFGVYDFTRSCPGVYVELGHVTPAVLLDQLEIAASAERMPDLILASDAWVALLADGGHVRDLTLSAGPDLLQRYLPATLRALSHGGQLYGLPVSLDLMVLYYNPEVVEQPARFVDDLLEEADLEHRVGIPVGFEEGMWGVSAFGGATTVDEGPVILDEDGLVAWLDWLLVAQGTPGFDLSTESDWLSRQFESGQATYLIGSSSLLGRFEDGLGTSRVGVLPLPLGPSNETRPFVRVDGLLLNASSPDDRADLALALAHRLTDVEGQTLLLNQVGRIPSNINVATGDHPNVASVLEQAKTVAVPRNDPSRDALWAKGDGVYFQALIGSSSDLRTLVGPFVREYNGDQETVSADPG